MSLPGENDAGGSGSGSGNSLFVTKWLDNSSCMVLDNQGFSNRVHFDYTKYCHIHILIKDKNKFNSLISVLLKNKIIDPIEYRPDLANLRNEKRINPYDVVDGGGGGNHLKGISVFMFCKYHWLITLQTFFKFNKTYFEIYDVSDDNPCDIKMNYYQCMKRNNPNYAPYGVYDKMLNFQYSTEHLPMHRVCSFDIELCVDVDSHHKISFGTGLHDKIIAISFVIAKYAAAVNYFEIEEKTTFMVWPDKNFKPENNKNVTIYPTERELLEATCELFSHKLKVSIITGYNIIGYDFPVLLNRMIALGIATKYYSINELNHIMLKRSGGGGGGIVSICENFQIIDVYLAVKNIYPSEYDSYSLDSIADILLSKRKKNVSFKQMNRVYYEAFKLQKYDNDFVNQLCDYVETDACLAIEIYSKTNIETHIFSILNVCFTDSFCYHKGVSAMLRNFFCISYPINGIVYNTYRSLPIDPETTNEMFTSEKNKAFKGATVMKTQRAIHANKTISVLDFTSLYPSIIREFNLSPLYVFHKSDLARLEATTTTTTSSSSSSSAAAKEEFLKRTRKIGNYYTLRSDLYSSPLAMIINTLIEKRKSAPTKSLNQAYKTVANSIYGLLGVQKKTIYLAALVTACGRNLYKLLLDYLRNDLRLRVVYGDTDSFFIFTENGAEIAEKANGYLISQNYKYISISLDYTASSSIFLAEKKKYILKLGGGSGGGQDNKLKQVGFQKKNIKKIFRRYSDKFLSDFFCIIEKHYGDDGGQQQQQQHILFLEKMKSLLVRTIKRIVSETKYEDYILSMRYKPFYEYVSLSSFNAICSYRHQLLNMECADEIKYSYVLTLDSQKSSKRESDHVEFEENIKKYNIPIDRIKFLKKVFNYIFTIEKYITHSDIFLDICKKVSQKEKQMRLLPALNNVNVWTWPAAAAAEKRHNRSWIIYYQEIFPKLSDYRLHFWEDRDKTLPQTLLCVDADFEIHHVTGDMFSFQELNDYMTAHEIKKINIYLKDDGFGIVDNANKLNWFLKLFYDEPKKMIHNSSSSSRQYTPNGELIIFDGDQNTVIDIIMF